MVTMIKYKRQFSKLFWLSFTIFLLCFSANSQEITLSDDAEISAITVDPGKNLSDTFGHSAFRVKDKNIGIDQVYNYGMYNFDTPNFYSKFAQGKLPYYLASYPFPLFYRNYVNENRGIREQVLNLNNTEKQQLYKFLLNNDKPENRAYLYDFFYDNCSTKLIDVCKTVLKDNVSFQNKFTKGKSETLRSLIHKYSAKNHPWGTFGIDLALGSVIDKKANTKDYLFLPDNVFKAFAESKHNNEPLVKETKTIFKAEKKDKKPIIFTPWLVFSLITLLIIAITIINIKNKNRLKLLDFLLFFITGLVGFLILFLWFATDHTATAKNYNILWAFAPNLIISFWMLKKELPNWVKKYSLLLLLLSFLMVVLWVLGVQMFPMALIPVLLALSFRHWFLANIN